MIEVIIDYGITNEWIATFADEKTYMACLPALEKYAEVNRGKIVESVQGDYTRTVMVYGQEHKPMHVSIVARITLR